MDWVTIWSVLGAIGVSGALSAWVGGYLGGLLPPPPRLVRAIDQATQGLRRPTDPTVDDGCYHLVLYGLDGDDAKEGNAALVTRRAEPARLPDAACDAFGALHSPWPGFTRAKRPQPQSPPADRWAAVQDHALAPSVSAGTVSPTRNSIEPHVSSYIRAVRRALLAFSSPQS